MSEAAGQQAAPADGGTVLKEVATLLRLAQAHDVANHIFDTPLQTVAALCPASAELIVVVMADSVFVNGALVKLKQGLFEYVDTLRKTFGRLAVQELSFPAGTSGEDIRDFLRVFQTVWRSARPNELPLKLEGRIRVRALSGDLASGPTFAIDARQNVLRTFARLAISMQDALEKLAQGLQPRTPALRRAVQALIDASSGHESLLAGLPRFPNFQGQLHHHLAATAALTLLMARRLGLSKAPLVDVVLAALLHDVGRAGLHEADLGQAEALAARAPAISLLKLTEHGLTAEAMTQAAAAFEASVPLEGVGAFKPGALGRLIAVPCRFDLLASAAPPRKALAPDQALRLIQDQAGTRFDPLVVKLFIATVGVFPIGTTVRLSNGALAIVLEVPRDAQSFTRPVVKIIRDERGPCDQLVDLAQEPGGPQIAQSVDAADEGVNPPAFLLS
jgi:hypothetical protein